MQSADCILFFYAFYADAYAVRSLFNKIYIVLNKILSPCTKTQKDRCAFCTLLVGLA